MDHAARTVRNRAADGAESLLRLRRPNIHAKEDQTNQDKPCHTFHFKTPLKLDSTDLCLLLCFLWMYHILDTQIECDPVDILGCPKQRGESMSAT